MKFRSAFYWYWAHSNIDTNYHTISSSQHSCKLFAGFMLMISADSFSLLSLSQKFPKLARSQILYSVNYPSTLVDRHAFYLPRLRLSGLPSCWEILQLLRRDKVRLSLRYLKWRYPFAKGRSAYFCPGFFSLSLQ